MLRLTTWSHPPQAQRIYSRIGDLTLGSNLPGKMSAGPEGMHFFIKWSKTNQMGRCVQHTKGRHMCPVPAMEAYRECCHCSTHSSPLFHFKDGRTLTSKSCRSTFLSLVWWSYVATIQPKTTPTLVQPCTVAVRTGLTADTIWNLRRENKAKARVRYKADPEKKKASVRDSYKADPEKKASVRDSYKADREGLCTRQLQGRSEKKKASVRDSYKADHEKKKASVRDSYNADIESKQSAKRQRYQEDPTSRRTALLKGSDIMRTSRRTVLLKGRNTRTIQLPLWHLKGIGIGMTPLSDSRLAKRAAESYSLYEPKSHALMEYNGGLEKAILRDSELLSEVNDAFYAVLPPYRPPPAVAALPHCQQQQQQSCPHRHQQSSNSRATPPPPSSRSSSCSTASAAASRSTANSIGTSAPTTTSPAATLALPTTTRMAPMA
eukprot:Em0043g18a